MNALLAILLSVIPVPPNDDDVDGIPNDIEGDVDTDGDGDPDRADPDSDDDRLPDALEDKDGDGQRQPWETDRIDADTDDDGLADAVEDADRDGVFGETAETNPLDPDSDGDAILDGADLCPLVYAPDWPDGCPHEPGEEGTVGAWSDRDGDGLSDSFETSTGCLNPDDPDTDGDSLGDAADPHYCDPRYTARGAGCSAVPAARTSAEALLLTAAMLAVAALRNRSRRGGPCTSRSRTSSSP